jgi:predicted MFS family arabinose efflux permease
VPLAWWLDWLSLGQLLVVTLLSGFAAVFFDVAAQSYLLPLVGQENLLEGNARLESSRTMCQVAGQAAGGGLADLFSAAYAVGAQPLCYLASAFSLSRIRGDARPREVRERKPMLPEIGAGLRYVLGDPCMRAITGCSATFNFFYAVASPLLVLLLIDELHQPEWTVGVLLALGGLGGLAGAMSTGWASRRFGHVRVLWVSLVACMPAGLLLAASSAGWGLLLFAVPWFVLSYGMIQYNVAQISFRQSVCPPGMMSRMNATVRFVIWGAFPLGGLAGGALGTWAGVRFGVAVAAAGMVVSAVWILASPLRGMRDLPAAAVPVKS